MTEIAIIGPGAIGCVVGAALIESGHEVTFCSRQTFVRLSVQKRGEAEKSFPARVITSDKQATPADWVLVCVKAHQTASAAQWLAATIGAKSKVAVLQNGVEQRENVAPFVPEGAPIVPVVVDIPASRTAPGNAEWQRSALLTVADDAAGRAFVALFAGTFIEASVTDDLVTRAWMKLCINAPGGAILALTGQPMSVFHKPGIADVARAILAECIAVGRAEGAKLDDALIEKQIASFLGAAPDGGNSMYADRMANRPMEWDARNGVIARKGARHGIPTPVSSALVPLLAALDPPAR